MIKELRHLLSDLIMELGYKIKPNGKEKDLLLTLSIEYLNKTIAMCRHNRLNK